MMSKSSVDCVLWRMMIEGGLIEVLINHMSTHATLEEKDWAERELSKCKQVVYAFQPLFAAEETARVLGITFKKAMDLVAIFGDPDEAIDAVKAASQQPTSET